MEEVQQIASGWLQTRINECLRIGTSEITPAMKLKMAAQAYGRVNQNGRTSLSPTGTE